MTERDATTRQFIEAGVRALLDNPRQLIERGLRSEDVVNEAGASQATFFRKFTTKSDFVDAVVAELVTPRGQSTEDIERAVEKYMASNADALRPTIIALVDDSFGALTDDNATAVQSLARIFGNAGAHKLDYERRDRLVLAAYTALFARTDAAFRRPFTARTFAVAVNALLDGFRTRNAFDATVVTAELVSDSLLALLGAVVDTTGMHQHLDDMVGPIETFDAPRPVPRDPRAALLSSARVELGKRGYFMTRMDDIADNAGVPRAAMKKLFPTKPHILVAALQSRIDALRESVADDVLIGLDELDIIDNFLLRCARLAADESAFMDALLVAVAHDTYGEPEGLLSVKTKLNIPAILGPVIARGQEKGTLSLFGTPVDLAAGITNTLLMRCFTRRNISPEDNALFVGNLLLRGLDATHSQR